MEVKFEEFKDLCEVKYSCATSKEEWAAAQKKAVEKLVKNVTVKGFRKGMGPIDAAARQLRTVDVLNEAADKVIDAEYKNMFNNYSFKAYAQPELKVTEFSAEKLAFEFVVPVAPVVTLGKYKGLSIEKADVKVSKVEIDAELNARALKNAELVTVDDEYQAAEGDTLNIDFKGFVNGKAFDGGDAKGYDLELGSGTFIPGFEAQLVGKKNGQDCDVVVTFPENYVANLAGKEATFKVHVNSVKKKVVPELNDDFAKDLDIEGVDTLEQLTENVKKELETKKAQQAEQGQFNKLVEEIVENAKVLAHDRIVSEEATKIVKNLEDRITQNGLKLDDYLKMTNKTKEDLVNEAKVQALQALKKDFVMLEIGAAEKLDVTDEEVDAKLGEFAAMYKTDVASLKKQLGDNLNGFKYQMLTEKIINFLKANNDLNGAKKAKKAAPKAEEVTEEAPVAKKAPAKKAAPKAEGEAKAPAKKSTKKAA